MKHFSTFEQAYDYPTKLNLDDIIQAAEYRIEVMDFNFNKVEEGKG